MRGEASSPLSNEGGAGNRSGFTLPEAMLSASLGAIALAATCVGIGMAARMSSEGTEQVRFNAIARQAAQKIERCIEEAMSVSVVNGTRADLVMPGLRVASLCFQAGGTSSPNGGVIVLDADRSVFGDEKVLCSHVSGEGASPIFAREGSGAVRVVFRVGGGEETGRRTFAEGVLVSLTVLPRNSTRWHGQ